MNNKDEIIIEMLAWISFITAITCFIYIIFGE